MASNQLTIKEIEERILKIDDTLSDKKREKEMASGIPLEIFSKQLEAANEPLLLERSRLEKLLDFKNSHRQLVVQYILAIVAVASLLINILVIQFGLNNCPDTPEIQKSLIQAPR